MSRDLHHGHKAISSSRKRKAPKPEVLQPPSKRVCEDTLRSALRRHDAEALEDFVEWKVPTK